MLKGKNIIVGVTGGIAAYKVVDVVSRLKKQNANVGVIMTKNATKFVTPLTFQTLALNKVYVGMFEEPKNFDVEHITLAEKADLFLIAPGTANVIGKIANGIADDFLTTTIMATKAKVIFAPAMNTDMYENPIVQKNIDFLEQLAYEFIEPGSGLLACQTVGKGRMAEPKDIVKYVVNHFHAKDLVGKKIVITAGPTIEPIDPVRYMTNHSSGKMGYELAKEGQSRGAKVVLITGPTNLNAPTNVEVVKVNTTMDMFKAVEDEFDSCDVLIKAAAPSDYRPAEFSDEKIKKKEGSDDELNIRYVRNPDIIEYFGKNKNKQILVGFAAETENIRENAGKKIKKKNLDFIVANNISQDGAGFKTDTNIVTIINKDNKYIDYPILNKSEISKIIIDKIKDLLDSKS